MTVGVIILVHEHLNRAEQLARHWVAGGCPVIIHVDRTVPDAPFNPFVASLSDEPRVRFQPAIAANGACGDWWRRL